MAPLIITTLRGSLESRTPPSAVYGLCGISKVWRRREAAEDQTQQQERREESRREEKRREDGTRCRTVKYHPRGTRAGPNLPHLATSQSREIAHAILHAMQVSARAQRAGACQFCFERPTHPPSHTHTRRAQERKRTEQRRQQQRHAARAARDRQDLAPPAAAAATHAR